MPRLTRDEIVARLSAQGLRFQAVTVEAEGEYRIADVDWNTKDVPHVNHVHEWANDVTFVVDRDLKSAVSLQKVLGIPFPVVLVVYDTGPDLTHVFTLLAWTIVSDIRYVEVTPTRTRAITTYVVGSNRFWMLFFPLIRLLLRRNFRQLMAEDLPMRERRGVLRSWGYTFHGDDGARRDIRDSLSVNADNVVPGEPGRAVEFAPVPLASIGDEGWVVVGRSDHLGLKLHRQGRRVAAYPRMCPHEGADLDAIPAGDGCLTCPWHGRRLKPLAVLDLDDEVCRVDTGHHRLEVVGDEIRIALHPLGATAAGTEPADDAAAPVEP